jgi:hypothetical protein
MGAIGAPCKLRFAASRPINNRPQVANLPYKAAIRMSVLCYCIEAFLMESRRGKFWSRYSLPCVCIKSCRGPLPFG